MSEYPLMSHLITTHLTMPASTPFTCWVALAQMKNKPLRAFCRPCQALDHLRMLQELAGPDFSMLTGMLSREDSTMI